MKFNDRPMFIAQLFNTFSLKNDWQLELGGEYHSKGYSENNLLENRYFNLSAAVQKAFLKDKSLIVRLSGSDLTRTARNNIFANFGGHIIRQSNYMDTQRICLSIRYRFNTAQNKYKGTGAGNDVMSRMQ